LVVIPQGSAFALAFAFTPSSPVPNPVILSEVAHGTFVSHAVEGPAVAFASAVAVAVAFLVLTPKGNLLFANCPIHRSLIAMGGTTISPHPHFLQSIPMAK
jgi:hypothetical protein